MMGMVYPPGRQVTFLDARDLDVGPDGRFEFLASAERPKGYAGVWHQIDPGNDIRPLDAMRLRASARAQARAVGGYTQISASRHARVFVGRL